MLILGILIGTTLPFLVQGDGTTTEPSWAPTGRLSQFQGFRTPRPRTEYDEAKMVFASVWAGWSAWSFCSNGVRIRVRACNTVRGFSCLGPNQETRPCDLDISPSRPILPSTDYDIVDPWENDRKEAMKQLYPDDTVSQTAEVPSTQDRAEPRPPGSNLAKTEGAQGFRAHAAPTHEGASARNVIDHAMIAYEDKRLENEGIGAPGMTPEKMFGAKSFALKPKKEKKDDEFKVEDITAKSEELSENQPSDFRPMNTLQFQPTISQTVPDASQLGDSAADLAPRAGLRPQPPQTPEVAKPIKAQQIKSKGVSRHLNEFFEIPDYEDLHPGNRLKQSGRSGWSAELIKREQGENVDITDVRSLKVEQEEKQLGDAIIHALTNTDGGVEHNKIDGRETTETEKSNELPEGTFFGSNPTRVQPKKSKSIEDETDSIEEQLSQLMASADPALGSSKGKITVEEERPEQVTLPPQPPSVTVGPQIRSESRTEAPVTVVSDESGEREVSIPTRSASASQESKEITVKSSKEDKIIGISRPEVDVTAQMKQDAERAGLKVISPLPQKKKGFGIAGFTFRKAILHQGEVTAHAGEVTTTTTQMTTTTTQDESKLSEDTLNALDWMLRNMSSAAQIDDEKFLQALNALEQPTTTERSVNNIDPIDLTSLLEADGPQFKKPTIDEPFKLKKFRSKKKKLRKLKKAKKDAAPKVHDGEFSPTNPHSVKVFPKYRSRNVRRGHALALGVQTARVVGESNEDKNSKEENDKSKELAMEGKDSQSADEIIEEINKLRAKMGQMDEQMEKMGGASAEKSKSKEVSTETEVKDRVGFIPGHGRGPMYEQPERIRIVSSKEELNTAAAWGEWSHWGECFCGKQMRHRQCYYGNASGGCKGTSFESRDCEGGECPSVVSGTTHVAKPQSLVVSNSLIDGTSLPRSTYRFARSILNY